MVLSPSTVISYRTNFKLLIKTVQTLKCDLWRWKSTCAQISHFFSPGFFVIPWWWESKTPEISISNFMMLHIELDNVMVESGLLTKFFTSMGKKNVKPHLHICARASPHHLHEHLYASVSVRKSCFHMRMNIHMFVHIMWITICPLWLMFEKPLPERALRMARRMTQQITRRICDWYARHSPRHSCEFVNAALRFTSIRLATPN